MSSFLGTCHGSSPSGQEPRVPIEEPDTSSNTWTSVFRCVCIGLVSTVLGGMLTGHMVVVTTHILETVGEDGPLMEALSNTLANDTYAGLRDTHLSSAVAHFSLIFSFLLLVLGVWVGNCTYFEVIKWEGISEKPKALSVAGSVCLLCISVTFSFLSFTLKHWLLFSERTVVTNHSAIIFLTLFLGSGIFLFLQCNKNIAFVELMDSIWQISPVIISVHALRTMTSLTTLIPINILADIFGKKYALCLNVLPVPMMLMIGYFFALCNIRVFDLQTVASTNTTALVLEGLFFGLWTTQMFTMTVAMSLFASWQTGGANKMCVGALSSGAALLGIIQEMIPVLDPWPLLGALMGVAGAAGLALSAGRAAADRYGRAGTVGAVLGAGVGAFVGTLSLGGVSSTFIALSTALIPALNYPEFCTLFRDLRDSILTVAWHHISSQEAANSPTIPRKPPVASCRSLDQIEDDGTGLQGGHGPCPPPPMPQSNL
ncbi:uncharacterized protein LOC132464088 [Gadus macrocephalus]|uniref:uncharacterized protein LOC132464088 n=1 Tax=Gadus macrocephalus TaxID=80720 RepID=UPI0028CB4E27|nr:uncharacterized protein LOC132464088 [Gadus macrocephalus]